jgi:hypothetical protein
LLFALLLVGAGEMQAQPEARVYFNRYEWVGLAGGYAAGRWRYELNTSWHQVKFIGLHSQWYQESPFSPGVVVFEEDVWRESMTTLTARVLRTGKKERPRFKLYYGLYLRYLAEGAKLKEPHWGADEEEVVNKFGAITKTRSNDICFGFLLGARGNIASNVFWDANLSLFPVRYTFRKQYYTDGSVLHFNGFSATYFEGDYTGHVLQVGIGYRFDTPMTQ